MIGGIPTSLKNDLESVGMMTFPIEWKNKSHVPHHQPVFIICEGIFFRHLKSYTLTLAFGKLRARHVFHGKFLESMFFPLKTH